MEVQKRDRCQLIKARREISRKVDKSDSKALSLMAPERYFSLTRLSTRLFSPSCQPAISPVSPAEARGHDVSNERNAGRLDA